MRISDWSSDVCSSDLAGPSSAGMMDDPDYNRLWQALGHDPTGMDRLVERTGLTTAELSSMLLVMELEGRIAVEHGRYARKRHETANTAAPGAGRGKGRSDGRRVGKEGGRTCRYGGSPSQ